MVTNSFRRRFSGHAFWLAIGGAVAVSGCSGGGGGAGSGGSTASGGAPGSGGATSSGGSTGAGGVVILTGTGGSTGSGGSTGAGGSAATGGSTGTGGSATGGSTGSGGSATGGATGSGGAATGGSTGTGGAAGSGGSAGASGGAGGSTSSGGAGGHAGGGGGSGGAGGATSCAGHAISLSANVAANNDPAKAAVLVAFNGSADLPTGNANRTIEFWAYVPSSAWVADANTMFFYGTNNRVADGFGLDFGTTSNGMGTIDPFTNNLFDNDNQPSGLSATSSQWAHFAMTWDGTTVRAYVNGVLKASKVSTSSTQKTLMTGVTALTIGGYPPAYFNGEIDEFRIWNVARSASDIVSTMNHTLAGNETGLTGYWKFDETSGTTAADSVTSAGHTPHPGMLSASSTANNPTWVVSTAPLSCP
jgi:Concanavalin A-like lectin/glucanases superfamily